MVNAKAAVNTLSLLQKKNVSKQSLSSILKTDKQMYTNVVLPSPLNNPLKVLPVYGSVLV